MGNNYNETISNCIADVIVNGDGVLGGLAGSNNDGTIESSFATGNVTGTGGEIGGLVGSDAGSNIINSYATGSVSGNYGVGGLVGDSWGSAIDNSYAKGTVISINEEYSDGFGGLVGFNNAGTINNSYAVGSVNATGEFVGGLVGNNGGEIPGEIYTSYYDSETTGQLDTGKGSPKTPLKCKPLLLLLTGILTKPGA